MMENQAENYSAFEMDWSAGASLAQRLNIDLGSFAVCLSCLPLATRQRYLQLCSWAQEGKKILSGGIAPNLLYLICADDIEVGKETLIALLDVQCCQAVYTTYRLLFPGEFGFNFIATNTPEAAASMKEFLQNEFPRLEVAKLRKNAAVLKTRQQIDRERLKIDLEIVNSRDIPLFEKYLQKGEIYLAAQQWDDAVSNLQKAYDLEPKSPAVHLNLAIAYFEKNQTGYVQSENVCRQALDGAQRDMRSLAISFLHAIRAHQNGAPRFLAQSMVMLNAGIQRDLAGQHGIAHLLYVASIAAIPENVVAHYNLATLVKDDEWKRQELTQVIKWDTIELIPGEVISGSLRTEAEGQLRLMPTKGQDTSGRPADWQSAWNRAAMAAAKYSVDLYQFGTSLSRWSDAFLTKLVFHHEPDLLSHNFYGRASWDSFEFLERCLIQQENGEWISLRPCLLGVIFEQNHQLGVNLLNRLVSSDFPCVEEDVELMLQLLEIDSVSDAEHVDSDRIAEKIKNWQNQLSLPKISLLFASSKFDNVGRNDPPEIQAIAALKAGKPKEAIEIIEAFFHKEGTDVRNGLIITPRQEWLTLGLAYNSVGEKQKAEESFFQAICFGGEYHSHAHSFLRLLTLPNWEELWTGSPVQAMLSFCDAGAMNWDENNLNARLLYLNAIAHVPSHVLSHFELAEISVAYKDYAFAQKEYLRSMLFDQTGNIHGSTWRNLQQNFGRIVTLTSNPEVKATFRRNCYESFL